jgi:hypothetical protein
MKDERNVRRSRAAGRKWQPVAILLAAVLMVLSVPFGSRSARAVDLDQNCSLKINPGNSIVADDIATANVVIDLYRVADAVPVTGFDTYDWQVNEPFSSITIDKKIDGEGWKKLAQQAADIVLGTAPAGKTEWDPSATAGAIDSSLKVLDKDPNQPITDLPAGLYLIIARGSNITEYAGTVTDETTGTTGTVTIAKSRGFKYSFSPELISMPTKAADETGVINTANPGPWIYFAEDGAEVTLKPSQEVNLGPLKIVKNLEDYAQREKTTDGQSRKIKDPATFIFKVVVYADETKAEVIFQDYVSIVFDAYGSQSATINGLPAGGYAEVTEEYSGRVYTIEPGAKNAVIVAEGEEDAPATVEFTNSYTDKEPGGGSVTNRFSYGEKDGWTLNKVKDDTDDAIANPDKTWGEQ